MSTREEILEIYKAGPEAVINEIKRLETALEQQEQLMAKMQEQLEIVSEQIVVLGELKAIVEQQRKQINTLILRKSKERNISTDF